MQVESKIMEQVKSVLSGFGNKYIDSNGALKRNKVIEDLDHYDKNLMTALLANQQIHDQYTEEIANTEIFKLNQFLDVFAYKEFWEDSFTKYTNRIGLTTDGKFISDSEDVVLDFPYKDTVLKAGMSKEDVDKEVGADEPFLNETLAHSEISELLEPKVMVNIKRYDKNGEHTISHFNKQDNLLIKGNNLIGLSSLSVKYAGKIKSIFIDPPYYFGSKKPADTFSYNSNFKLSSWLTFMKTRLELSKKLLTENGTLFISMSDEGVHYLKVLTDSIFGQNNFIADVTWESRTSVSSDGLMSLNSNHILIYAKNVDCIDKNSFRLALNKESFKYNDHDGRGPYRVEPFDAPHIRKNLEYEIQNPTTHDIYVPPRGRCWRTTEDEFKKLLKDGRIRFGVKGTSKPQLKAYYYEVKDSGKGKAASTIWHGIKENNSISWLETNTNTSATKHLRQIFGSAVFTNPKPEELIQRILELSTNQNDLVLDFFMGSATTQAVAMKMHRHFIGIEQMDYINTVSVPRLQKVIAGEQGGISKDVNWQGGGSFVYAELMEKNMGYLKDLENATTIDDLNSVYQRMKQGADYDFRVDLNKYENDPERKSMSFEEQKKLLIKMLNKNQLYFNEDNIDDADVRALISDSDYQFNKSFYGKGND
ncbi:site-specific DNA-methyltransferase (plasmid) [Limosilactobacillus panis]|uniref:DNA methyltransferase n=1 Tax=Limosilactobacillus panis TaxID=47493 RepID=UPI001C9373F3|nr:DNA methyltransferase [Limosilactobacillus panis]QZN94029.1 site-specific DNA-methyltransferase [Limosilactobacillus panis]UUF81193.1 site-specific DNA-methyltransferase [Xanthomonas oryzae pv. oryzae]